jgi:hypothetical protein
MDSYAERRHEMTNYAAIGIVLVGIMIFFIFEVFGYDAGVIVSRKFVDFMEWVMFWR